MRYKACMLFLLVFSGVLTARQETLISGDFKSGGFGGPVCKIGSVYQEAAFMMGGRGGWIINHQFVLGGGAYGLVTDIASKEHPDMKMNMGYGGIEIEYIKQPNKLVHFSIMALLGGGGAGFSERHTTDWNDDYEYDTFFIAEPSVHIMLNITEFFRAGLGGSYRFVTSMDTGTELSNNDLGGPTLVMTIKFGNF
ncbi:hypothetical protein JW835_01190 [bacterium]|nr:hypothetical protein [bacterium]